MICHINYPFHAKKNKDKWIIDSKNQPRFWSITKGMQFSDSFGKIYSFRKIGGQNVVVNSLENCSFQGCLLEKKSIPRFAPRKNWKEFELKILGSHRSKDTIFMSGLAARPLKKNRYKYWGTSKAKMFLSVIRLNTLYLRKKVSPKKSMIISLPKQPIVSR